MKSRIASFAATLFVAAFVSSTTFASRLEVDQKASSITFAARSTMHTVEGSAGRWTLALTVPEGGDVPDSAVFTTEVPSLTTFHKKRDEEMQDWFEPGSFGTITYRLQSLTKSGADYTSVGELEMHGIKAPVTMPVKIKREGDQLTIHGEVVVDHRNFGLPQIRKFGMLTVDPEVSVVIHVVGTLK